MRNLILSALILASAFQNALSQDFAFYNWDGNGVGSKVESLFVGQTYLIGFDSQINQQRANLISQGFSEVINTETDSRLWYFPTNSFWLNTALPGGGYNMGIGYIDWGNGTRLGGDVGGHWWGAIDWVNSPDATYGQFHPNNSYSPAKLEPSFEPINYTPIQYNTTGTFTVSAYGGGGFTIWNGTAANRSGVELNLSKTITVTTIPEPSSLSLLALGGVVVMAGRRRNCGNEDS